MENIFNTETSKKKILVLAGAVFLALVVLVAVYFSGGSKPDERVQETAEDVRSAIEKATASVNVEVPTSVNPVRQVLPTENPIDKANPFNNVYKNPFE